MLSGKTRDVRLRREASQRQKARRVRKACVEGLEDLGGKRPAFLLHLRVGAAGTLTKVHRRCGVTGRGRGVHRHHRRSRIQLRSRASAGLLAAVKKASW